MKKKTIVVGLLSGILSATLLFPRTSSAFWPFDKWFTKGEVKGEQTEGKSSISSLFRRATPTPTVTPTLGQDEIEKVLTEEQLNKAVRGKKISEAQKKAMLAKLAVIKARRAELKRLQEAFVAWMKANRIDPRALMGETATGSGSLKEKGTPTSNTVTVRPVLKTTPATE